MQGDASGINRGVGVGESGGTATSPLAAAESSAPMSAQQGHFHPSAAEAASEAVLGAQMRVIADELATLRIKVNDRRRVWTRDIAIMLSLFTFIFSVATTIFSYMQASEQRLHDSRTELRNLTQRLSALPAEYLELSRQYNTGSASDRTTLGQLNRRYNTELQLLARQAAEVINRLPTGQVSATEYSAVGIALQLGGLLEEGRQLARQAVLVARDTSDEILALQAYGQSLFYGGDYAGGREQFRRALAETENDPTLSSDYKASSKVSTLVLWVETELSQGQCENAQEWLEEARLQLEGMSNPALASAQTANMSSLQNLITLCDNPNTLLP